MSRSAPFMGADGAGAALFARDVAFVVVRGIR
jgi:hypothetical protein